MTVRLLLIRLKTALRIYDAQQDRLHRVVFRFLVANCDLQCDTKVIVAICLSIGVVEEINDAVSDGFVWLADTVVFIDFR